MHKLIGPKTIRSAIRWASKSCEQISESSKLDSELLLAFCLQKPRSYLYSWPEAILAESQWQQFQQLINLRLKPTPVAYLLGEKEFFSLQLFTTAETLVPRPETELLVDIALDILRSNPTASVLDLGTGTGAIAIALKNTQPQLEVIATDFSPETTAITQKNINLHQLDIELHISDWYQQLNPAKQFDCIVSNPPYIPANDPCLKHSDLPAEPISALCPGETGLEALEIIISQASLFLKPKAFLILEHGYDQQYSVENLLQQAKFNHIQCHLDFNQLPRVSCAQLP